MLLSSELPSYLPGQKVTNEGWCWRKRLRHSELFLGGWTAAHSRHSPNYNPASGCHYCLLPLTHLGPGPLCCLFWLGMVSPLRGERPYGRGSSCVPSGHLLSTQSCRSPGLTRRWRRAGPAAPWPPRSSEAWSCWSPWSRSRCGCCRLPPRRGELCHRTHPPHKCGH